MGLAHSPRIIMSGLTLALDAGNPKSYPGSGISMYDLSGSGRVATFKNSPTFSNNAIVTNDTNAYIQLAYSASDKWTPLGSVGTSTKTFEIWAKTSDTNGGSFFSSPWNASGGYNYQVTAGDWFIANINYNYGGIVSQTFAVNLADGIPHQLVCWVDATNMGYYIDGGKYSGSKAHNITVDVGTNGYNSSLPSPIGTVYPYGEGWAGNSGMTLSGEYYAYRIYNRVLSADEVRQNFNALRGRFGL